MKMFFLQTTMSCWVLLCIISVSSLDNQNVTAEPGQHVNLTCEVPDSKSVIVVLWRRADVTDEYVLLYRDDRLIPTSQEPSFKNRVDLRDRQMKDGDVSLVLKNVTTNDTGVYECRVQNQGNRERKLICRVSLNVSPPGSEMDDGGNKTQSVGLIVGLLVLSFIVAVAAILIIKKTACLMQKRSAADSPKEEAV